jgi:hypothetical protein
MGPRKEKPNGLTQAQTPDSGTTHPLLEILLAPRMASLPHKEPFIISFPLNPRRYETSVQGDLKGHVTRPTSALSTQNRDGPGEGWAGKAWAQRPLDGPGRSWL